MVSVTGTLASDWLQVVRGRVSGTASIPLTTVTRGAREVTALLSWDTANNWV